MSARNARYELIGEMLMNADSKLSLKCPSCGNTQQKSLSAIKALKSFDCGCGYTAEIQTTSMFGPRSASSSRNTATESTTQKDSLAITA